jgi:hypothetical protein
MDAIDWQRENWEKISQHYTLNNYYKNIELKTIEFRLPRTLGNTSIALNLLEKLNDAVLFKYSNSVAANLKKNIKDPKTKEKVIGGISSNNVRGRTFDIVVVDDAKFLQINEPKKFKEFMECLFCNTIVLLG